MHSATAMDRVDHSTLSGNGVALEPGLMRSDGPRTEELRTLASHCYRDADLLTGWREASDGSIWLRVSLGYHFPEIRIACATAPDSSLIFVDESAQRVYGRVPDYCGTAVTLKAALEGRGIR